MDDLRLLLMREPRGHSRDVGRDPAAADAPRRRLGRAVHRGLGLPADVRARDDRRRHGARGDRHGRGDRAGDGRAARHAGRARRGARRGRGRPRDGRSRCATCPAFLHARDRAVDVPGLGRSSTTWRSAATSTRCVPRRVGLEVDPARARRADRARRWRSWPRSTRPTAPVHPEDARIAGCRHVVLHAPGRDGADARNATAIHPGWLDRSPCGTGTSRAAGAAARPRRAGVGDAFVNESVIGTRFTGRIVGETTVGGLPGGRARRSPAARGSPGMGRVPARRRRSVPGGLRAVNPDVVVVGAGIVGVCAALRAGARGATVTVLERGSGWGEECSWGNAGLLVPSHARPIAAPENLRAGLRWMVRRDSPFGMRLQPSLVPWLLRYARASTAARAAAGETLQRALSVEGLARFDELAAEGIDGGSGATGCSPCTARQHARGGGGGVRDGPRARRADADPAEARELEPALTARRPRRGVVPR